ncbi:hypothetical protein [Planococcus versutus]|uniref:Uncharacterized protein n=1 Tax=Planococcus versutus TaxID=1302659 RepID=A0A1B1S1M2_9BACL|nr:hypothetical protein [Planococcus versutus]ANU27064.1 hypothetical protein I858_008680 [Planococcus versutus]
MTESTGELIARKLKATFLASFIFAMAWSIWDIYADEEIVYHLGEHFYGMTLTYFFYVGFFVLTFGNLVSYTVELFQREWFERANWLYVFIVGASGSAIGVLFPFKFYIIAGMLIATLCAVIDKWLLRKWRQDKGNKAFFISALAAFVLLWGYFQLTTPPLPPVTAEEAVEFVTRDDDTKIDDFPDEVGTWKGVVAGYLVERTTAVKQLEKDVYLVSFSEKWQKGTEKGTNLTSYIVDRGSMTIQNQGINIPPYDMVQEPE